MSTEDIVTYQKIRDGKPEWDIDCDRAFLQNMDAARRVREAVRDMPYAKRSERSDFCLQTAENMLRTNAK